MRPVRTATLLAAVVAILAGCSASATGAPAATPAPTSAATPAATATLAPTPVATPVPATPVATPAEGTPVPSVATVASPSASSVACDPATDVPNSCAGALPVGTHATVHFQPGFSFAVGDGWANTVDESAIYYLVRAADPSGNTIFFFDNPTMGRSDPACDGPAQPGFGRSVADVVRFLTTNPGLTASAPKPVTLGGLSGQQVEVTVAPTWTQLCPKFAGTAWADKPFVMIATEAKPTNDGRWWGIGSPDRWRVYVLDGGAKGTLFIGVDASLGTWDAFSGQAATVLASLKVNP